MTIRKIITAIGILLNASLLFSQSIRTDLEKMNHVMTTSDQYHIRVSTVYQDNNANSISGKQYDLFKMYETKMSVIGSDKMIMNDQMYLGISTQNKTIKLMAVDDQIGLSDYTKELLKMEELGAFKNVVFSSSDKGHKYTIKKPTSDILKMHIIFGKSGFLSQVIYEFEPNIEGNPYANVTINYSVSKDVSGYQSKGLYFEKYLDKKMGKYTLSKEFENYEFINLL